VPFGSGAAQAVSEEYAAAPLEKEDAAAYPMQIEAMMEIKEGQRNHFLFQFLLN
jgi:hypothetical protein